MIEQNIKAISQLVNKPLADLNESDIQKIIKSGQKDLIYNVPTMEYLMENTSEIMQMYLQPLYLQIIYESSMEDVEKHLLAYTAKPEEYSEELKIQMESKLESTNSIDILAASVVLLTLFPDYDFSNTKENLKEALSLLEEHLTILPLPAAKTLLENILQNLYIPVVSMFKEFYGEVLIEPNEAFRNQLEALTAIIESEESEEANNG